MLINCIKVSNKTHQGRAYISTSYTTVRSIIMICFIIIIAYVPGRQNTKCHLNTFLSIDYDTFVYSHVLDSFIQHLSAIALLSGQWSHGQVVIHSLNFRHAKESITYSLTVGFEPVTFRSPDQSCINWAIYQRSTLIWCRIGCENTLSKYLMWTY